MSGFFGRYEHALDPKGRIILPSKFRPAFADGGFLTQFNERCLALWAPDAFEARMNEMQLRQADSAEMRNLARIWAMGTQEVEIDKQGRMAIPAFLRDYARLTSEVLIHGAIDRVELWNPEEWQSKVAPATSQFVAEGNDG